MPPLYQREEFFVKRYAIGLVVLASLLLAGCGNSETEDTVKDFIRAWEDRKPDQINQLMCDDGESVSAEAFAEIESVKYEGMKIEGKGQDKSEAQVQASGTEIISYTNGDKVENKFDRLFMLRPDDNSWCIFDIR